MTDEIGVMSGSSPDAGVVQSTGESPTPSQDTGFSPSADVNAQPVQGEQPDDPLAGFPSNEELDAAVANKTPFAEQAARIKRAYEALKPQFTELQTKHQTLEPFQPHLERFEKPEQLQEIVNFREKLYGWEKDPVTGQLVPATQSLVEDLTRTAPERADYLAADLLNGETVDSTGRRVPRIDVALEAMAKDPARRAKALSILGGVEPTSIAPTWQPEPEELDAIAVDPTRPTDTEKALQDIYKKLPYDTRQSLKLNDPEFVRDYLQKEKFAQDTMAREAQRQQHDAQIAQERAQYIQREAENAGNALVEQSFRDGFTSFAKNICERFQPIKPLDPQSPEAQGMDAAQLAATNEKIQRVNRGAGLIVSLVTAATAVPDTAFLVREIANEIGLTDDLLQRFDAARVEFATHNRNFGNLRFRAGLGQNGNGNGNIPQDIGMLQTEAQRAQRALIANGNAVAGPIMALLSDFFSLQAQSHNQTLNGAAQARQPITGSSYDPTQAAHARPPATSEAEIRQRMRADAQMIANR